MTTTTHEAATHAVVSHGADFFGEDRYSLKSLASLAGYAEGALSYAERKPLVELLQNPGDGGSIQPENAAFVAELLLKVSRHRFVKAKPSALARALADAAARAAAEDEPWVWRIEAGADA
jgi:hypothetical protein